MKREQSACETCWTRALVVIAPVLLMGSEPRMWSEHDEVVGKMLVSAGPSVLNLKALVTTDSDDDEYVVSLDLAFSPTNPGGCLDLTVAVEGSDGEGIGVGVTYDDCRGVGLTVEPCYLDIPCVYTVQVSSPVDVEIGWAFQAEILGTLAGCRAERPNSRVEVTEAVVTNAL